MRNIIVVDIDDTVSIVGDRISVCNNSHIDWDEFHERCNEDEPKQYVIDMVRQLSLTFNIVFCTMRPISQKKKTEEWISKHIGIDYNILMREHEEDMTAGEIKTFMLHNAGILPEHVIVVIDDNVKVINKLKQEGYNCMRVVNSSQTYRPRRW